MYYNPSNQNYASQLPRACVSLAMTGIQTNHAWVNQYLWCYRQFQLERGNPYESRFFQLNCLCLWSSVKICFLKDEKDQMNTDDFTRKLSKFLCVQKSIKSLSFPEATRLCQLISELFQFCTWAFAYGFWHSFWNDVYLLFRLPKGLDWVHAIFQKNNNDFLPNMMPSECEIFQR